MMLTEAVIQKTTLTSRFKPERAGLVQLRAILDDADGTVSDGLIVVVQAPASMDRETLRVALTDVAEFLQARLPGHHGTVVGQASIGDVLSVGWE